MPGLNTKMNFISLISAYHIPQVWGYGIG